MISWLQKYGGYTTNGLTVDEKKELETLRIQVKKYREMENNNKEQESDKSFSDDNDDDDVDKNLDNILDRMTEKNELCSKKCS